MAKIKKELVNTAAEQYGYCTMFDTGERLLSENTAWRVSEEKEDKRGPFDEVNYFKTEAEAGQFIKTLQ